jgi:NAD(P) transhydrogenase subunit beta
MQLSAITILLYAFAAVCLVLGIKFLSSPKSARRGNRLAAFGMFVALVTTGVDQTRISWAIVGPTIAVGAIIGAVSSRAVRMTAMPQMVAMFNGMGAGAAGLIGVADYWRVDGHFGGAHQSATFVLVFVLLSVLIGSLSFTGSAIAFGKLQGVISGRAITFGGQKAINGIILLAIIVLGICLIAGVDSYAIFWSFSGLALLLGVMFVIPVGGADMPVIVSLLNSFTGTAAAMAGFVLGIDALIVAGALVGASGFILTQLMSKAMNRSLFNVLFAGVGATSGTVAAGAEDRPVHSASAEDLAPILAYADQVVIVPGYGLAVARAQHDVKELGVELEKRGVTVKYGIHPVAGRMPGHMNVLLAEADVPYSQLKEMDEINPEMARTDVAIVIGANDVVNPAAKDQPGSPIYGMPIINVDEAKTVVVMKRSMASGFAGIDNPLFYEPKTLMYFGDAHESVAKLLSAVKEQG